MPSFKIEDLMNSVYGRTTNVRDLPQNQGGEAKAMAGRKGKRPLQETETLILTFIAGSKTPVTLMQICEHLERKPAPHYRAILRDLEARGKIIKTEDYEAGPSIPRFLYSINRG